VKNSHPCRPSLKIPICRLSQAIRTRLADAVETKSWIGSGRVLAWRAWAVAAGIILNSCTHQGHSPVGSTGTLVHSVRSEYSDIRVRDSGGLRSLSFVEPGLEVRQTSMLLADPGHLVVPYTRYMFAAKLVNHPQQRVLIVGLGGGSMVRFLNQHFPRTAVDAVEIDPEIVRIAATYFGTRPSRRTRIFTADAFDYLRRDVGRYDVIYMDAFLEPGPQTDPRGIPQQLKTADFLRSLRQKLTPGGAVAFNLSEHAHTDRDIQTIASAFPTTYEYRVPGTKNRVVIATEEARPRSSSALRNAGRALDAARPVGFSFEAMPDALR
jgi:spermidine synthase